MLAATLSLYRHRQEEDEQLLFPSYDAAGCFEQTEGLKLAGNLRLDDSGIVLQSFKRVSDTTALEITTKMTEDDLSIRHEPSRQVDYLSHDWTEEDVWSSWRYIVSTSNIHSDSERLENASWRAWAKAKYGLKTVSPEVLEW